MRTKTLISLILLSTVFLTNAAYAQYYYPQTNCTSAYPTTYSKKRHHTYNNNYNNYNYSYINLIPTTYPALNIYQNTAKINGYVNYSATGYNQNSGYAWFEYGTNQSYLNFSTNKANIYYSTSIDANLTNLACGQTYYFRAVSSGPNGTQYGSTLSFTTASCYNYYQNYNPYNYYNYNYYGY